MWMEQTTFPLIVVQVLRLIMVIISLFRITCNLQIDWISHHETTGKDELYLGTR